MTPEERAAEEAGALARALPPPGGPSDPTRAGDGGFWCALCATHRRTAAEIYAHVAKEHPNSNLALAGLRKRLAADGVTVPVAALGLSTSARLRQVQADLAASQADLTRVEQERDEARDEARRLRVQLGFADARIRTVERERDSLARRCAVRFNEAELLRAELASARQARDGLAELYAEVCGQKVDLTAELAAEGRRVAQLQVLLAEAARARDLARAELATASKEVRLLRAARQWIVARDGGRDCVRCEQEIRRGEAYELLPGVDQLAHIHCPTEGATHG